MAHKEACQLFIEQEIKEGLAQGKTPYSIGKDLAAWVEELFETSIPARTIEQKARRQTNATNVATPLTPLHSSEIPQIQVEPSSTPPTYSEIPKIQVEPPVEHGGVREGAGRRGKYEPPAKYAGPFIEAMLAAGMAGARPM